MRSRWVACKTSEATDSAAANFNASLDQARAITCSQGTVAVAVPGGVPVSSLGVMRASRLVGQHEHRALAVEQPGAVVRERHLSGRHLERRAEGAVLHGGGQDAPRLAVAQA